MSGGSYSYLFTKEPGDLVNGTGEQDLEAMIDRLAGLGYAEDAARESMVVLAELRAARVRLGTMMERLSGIWKAVEWWDSSDSGEEDVRAALLAYRGQA